MEENKILVDGKSAIIDKIISEAKSKANANLDNAKVNAHNKKMQAEDWAEEYKKTQEEILQKEVSDVISRRLTVADLDVRKITLQAKQDAIGKVLDCVYKKLCGLNKSEYLKLISGMISNYADENDCVTLSCDGVLSSEDIKGLKVFQEKHLSVAGKKGAFCGGVMLIGKLCDKDLTFKSIIENDKEGLIAEISEELFGNE